MFMLIDHCDKTISIKIVYFGPAFSGKTTSIKALFTQFGKGQKLHSIESTVNRTLFFDYGTVTFQNEEWKLKIHIYTTTGQDFYFITRPITLRAVDGIILVLDSQIKVYERNLSSWNELISYYRECIDDIPIIIAFNKQDLSEKLDPDEFLKEINYRAFKKIDVRFTSALHGEGIMECFEDILSAVLKKYYDHKFITAIN